MACLQDKLPKPALMTVRLVITLKQSVRRYLYRRWEGQVVGRELRTKTVDLERMYRGNTPYPIGKIRQATRTYPTQAMATRALGLMTSRRKALGYRAA
jgi:hypothetical protein